MRKLAVANSDVVNLNTTNKISHLNYTLKNILKKHSNSTLISLTIIKISPKYITYTPYIPTHI